MYNYRCSQHKSTNAPSRCRASDALGTALPTPQQMHVDHRAPPHEIECEVKPNLDLNFHRLLSDDCSWSTQHHSSVQVA